MSGAIGNAADVDLNTASEQELTNVGGLGAERAGRIVQRRPFRSWDEVREIEGFGQKLVDDLRRAGARIGGSS